jgi:adenylylsulfate kinase
MLEAQGDAIMTHATQKRSVVKALSYRVLIVSLDFTVIFLLTGKPKVAVGFMIVSNIYTTLGYFLHERLWARIRWGIARFPATLDATCV